MGTTLQRTAYAMPMYLVGPDGEIVNLAGLLQTIAANSGSAAAALDTDGNVVPTYKAHEYTYDASGNLATDIVIDDGDTWVRSYAYTMGAQSSDSGWVKQ